MTNKTARDLHTDVIRELYELGYDPAERDHQIHLLAGGSQVRLNALEDPLRLIVYRDGTEFDSVQVHWPPMTDDYEVSLGVASHVVDQIARGLSPHEAEMENMSCGLDRWMAFERQPAKDAARQARQQERTGGDS